MRTDITQYTTSLCLGTQRPSLVFERECLCSAVQHFNQSPAQQRQSPTPTSYIAMLGHRPNSNVSGRFRTRITGETRTSILTWCTTKGFQLIIAPDDRPINSAIKSSWTRQVKPSPIILLKLSHLLAFMPTQSM